MSRSMLVSFIMLILLYFTTILLFNICFQSSKSTTYASSFQLPREIIVQTVTSRSKHVYGIFNTTIPQTRAVTTPPSAYVVPNIVHYIWFGKDHVMMFHQMISVISAHKLLNPDHIMLHCDFLPTGGYWRYLSAFVNFTIVKMEPPQTIFGHKLEYIQHKSDIARFIILSKYGGIYLDFDSIVLKSFDPLRKYEFVMGQERPNSLLNAILISKKNATFLHIWKETYRNFSSTEWAVHSCQIPFQLHKQYPQHIHVDKDTLINPGSLYRHLIFNLHTKFDWSKNYAMHLFYNHYKHKQPYNPSNIWTLDSVFGQISRYVLFGSPRILYNYL